MAYLVKLYRLQLNFQMKLNKITRPKTSRSKLCLQHKLLIWNTVQINPAMQQLERRKRYSLTHVVLSMITNIASNFIKQTLHSKTENSMQWLIFKRLYLTPLFSKDILQVPFLYTFYVFLKLTSIVNCQQRKYRNYKTKMNWN